MSKKAFVIAIVSSATLMGCSDSQPQTQHFAAPNVVVQPVDIVPMKAMRSYIGRVEAIEDVSITAQVSGYVVTRDFTEGQLVKKGDLLYTIDPAPFEANVANAKAAVAQAEASLIKADLDYKRGQDLLPRGGISKSEFDALTAHRFGAEAQLEAATAQLESAKVSLSHTNVVAPFTGRIGESNVSIGDLVSANSGVLTTVVSLDPIHTAFNVSERERLQFGMDKFKGDGKTESSGVEVLVRLENGEYLEQFGQLDFVNNRIDIETGTLSLRAKIDNKENRLLPGQHINIELREKRAVDTLVIPRRSVQTDLEGNYVMLVKEGNVAERVNVSLGRQTDQGIVITDGLNPNDQVITQGLQRVRNGMEVSASKVQEESDSKPVTVSTH